MIAIMLGIIILIIAAISFMFWKMTMNENFFDFMDKYEKREKEENDNE